jgi:hypothetical protein
VQVGRLLGDERVLDEDDGLGGEAGEVDEWQRGLARGEIDGAPAAHAMGREGDAGEEVLEELLRVSRGEVGDAMTLRPMPPVGTRSHPATSIHSRCKMMSALPMARGTSVM